MNDRQSQTIYEINLPCRFQDFVFICFGDVRICFETKVCVRAAPSVRLIRRHSFDIHSRNGLGMHVLDARKQSSHLEFSFSPRNLGQVMRDSSYSRGEQRPTRRLCARS